LAIALRTLLPLSLESPFLLKATNFRWPDFYCFPSLS
jgi:hypothetical protein